MKHADAPAYAIGASEEHPFAGQKPGGGWCENYALVGNDPAAGINLCLYLGRQPHDLEVWHEIVLIALPDDRVQVWKSAGRGGTDNGGGGAAATFRCIEPGRRWSAAMDGFTWTTTAAALEVDTFSDGPWTPTRLNLSFEAAMPPWVLGNQDLEHAQEHLHYEQTGRLVGSLQVGADRWDFIGSGHRDHSRGPRDFRAIRDHAWVNCVFPGGRSFALYRMRLVGDAGAVAVACVFDGQALSSAAVTSMPLLAEVDNEDSYELILDVNGTEESIHAEILKPVGTVSYVTPNHMTIGASASPQACQIVRECATRFTWSGEVGYGHTQRSTQAVNRCTNQKST